MDYNEWLAKFNPNHDPKNNQFSDGPGCSRYNDRAET